MRRKKQKAMEESYAALLRRVWPLVVYLYKRRLCSHGVVFDDFMQDYNMHLWISFVKLDGDMTQLRCKESTFAYIVADNLAISYLRKIRKSSAGTKNIPIIPDNNIVYSTNDEDLNSENREYLLQLIDSLNLKEKDIILLDLEGYSDEEIADKMGLSVRVIGTRLSRIRKKLKEIAAMDKK